MGSFRLVTGKQVFAVAVQAAGHLLVSHVLESAVHLGHGSSFYAEAHLARLRHLRGVAQEPEAGDVGAGPHASPAQHAGCRTIEAQHPIHRRLQVGRLGAIVSITCMRSACCAVRLEAFVTASTGQLVLRLCVAASERREAAASLITLRRRSEPMLPPFELIGIEEPMFETGESASTSPASAIQTPAEAARAPYGET